MQIHNLIFEYKAFAANVQAAAPYANGAGGWYFAHTSVGVSFQIVFLKKEPNRKIRNTSVCNKNRELNLRGTVSVTSGDNDDLSSITTSLHLHLLHIIRQYQAQHSRHPQIDQSSALTVLLAHLHPRRRLPVIAFPPTCRQPYFKSLVLKKTS